MAKKKIKTIINEIEVEVERDRWAIDVIREMGIEIPTLCYHPALEPYGACRLCVVEVTKGKWTWLSASCDLPIREGLSIKTDTPAVKKSRQLAIELVWARAPQAEGIAELAAQLGVKKPRFNIHNDIGKCILCGLCVRVCDKLIGVSALNFAKRGIERNVDTPFGKQSNTCIGCNACIAVCPTGHIVSVDKGHTRSFEAWNTELEMLNCKTCSKPYMPVKEFEYIQSKLGNKTPLQKICPSCLKSETAYKLQASSVVEK